MPVQCWLGFSQVPFGLPQAIELFILWEYFSPRRLAYQGAFAHCSIIPHCCLPRKLPCVFSPNVAGLSPFSGLHNDRQARAAPTGLISVDPSITRKLRPKHMRYCVLKAGYRQSFQLLSSPSVCEVEAFHVTHPSRHLVTSDHPKSSKCFV